MGRSRADNKKHLLVLFFSGSRPAVPSSRELRVATLKGLVDIYIPHNRTPCGFGSLSAKVLYDSRGSILFGTALPPSHYYSITFVRICQLLFLLPLLFFEELFGIYPVEQAEICQSCVSECHDFFCVHNRSPSYQLPLSTICSIAQRPGKHNSQDAQILGSGFV